MTALTKPRKIAQRGALELYHFGVKASSSILQSGLVVLLAGYAIEGRAGVDSTEAGTMQVVGVAYDSVTGSSNDGDVNVRVGASEFPFANSTAGDQITVADIGKPVYLKDDQTVAKTSNTNVRPIAGRVTGVDSDGTVWVRVGPGMAY